MPWETELIRVVVGILVREKKILVCERPSDKPYSGYWEFPGGKIEDNEQTESALKRELHEEVGIDVITAEHLFDHSHTYPDKTVLLEIWKVTSFSGEPHGKEQQVVRWATFDELLTLNLLEGNWPLIAKLKESI